MSTGFITTAIVLIIGYVIVTRVIGLAFRLAVPVVLIIVLGGAGVLSGLMPDHAPGRYPADRPTHYEEAQHRLGGDIGDLRLRDIADMAVDAARLVLKGSLALLNSLSERESAPEPRWADQRRGEAYETLPYSEDDLRQRETRQNW